MRFSIVDKKDDKVIGTIEMFRRESEIVAPFYDWFECSNITTKAALYAIIRALLI